MLIGGIAAYLAFDVMVLWAAFHAFDAAPYLGIVWIAYLVGQLGGLIPLPGGVGGLDGGLVGALLLCNVPIALAASAVLAYRAITLWTPVILGSAAFVSLRRMLGQEAAKVAYAPVIKEEVIEVQHTDIGSPAPTEARLRSPRLRVLHRAWARAR